MFVSVDAVAKRKELGERLHLPILWDHPHLGLLVPGFHVHENPIFLRWQFTSDSSSLTRPIICGIGVS